MVATETISDKAYSEKWLRDYAMRMNEYDSPEDAFAGLLDGLRKHKLYTHDSNLHNFKNLKQPNELKKHTEHYLNIQIK